MSAIERKCPYCGSKPRPGRTYCNSGCSNRYRAQQHFPRGTGPRKVETWQPAPKKYKSPISDKEQMRINREIDSKHDAPLHYRHYKPGTPEFEKVAAQCTPPDRIPVESYACFGIPDPGGRLFDERK